MTFTGMGESDQRGEMDRCQGNQRGRTSYHDSYRDHWPLAAAEATERRRWIEWRAITRQDPEWLVIGFGRQGGDEDGSEDSGSVDLVEVDVLN